MQVHFSSAETKSTFGRELFFGTLDNQDPPSDVHFFR